MLTCALLVTSVGAGCKKGETKEDQPPTEAAVTEESGEANADPKESSTVEEGGEGNDGLIPAPADVEAPPANAEVTNSGLATRVINPGTGTEYPQAESVVTVHYTGWTTDGKMFDSSVARGEPISFPLNKVIPGWKEGVMLMVTGETRRMWIPESLAYAGREGAPAGMLVFDVELIAIQPPGTPIE
ncbi:unnamed protein product [Laminaria digitata]